MKAAIYTRVSTDRQTTVNQLEVLRKTAERRGFEVVRVVEEVESGAKRRPALDELLKSDGYDVILIWALDRLGRGGALEALQIMDGLAKRNISVISEQESWLDTSKDNPLRDVLVAFSATIAKMERSRLISRTRAGLAVAKANGKQLGRPSPKLPPQPERERIVAAWRAETGGFNIRDLAARLGGVSTATAWRIAKAMEDAA